MCGQVVRFYRSLRYYIDQSYKAEVKQESTASAGNQGTDTALINILYISDDKGTVDEMGRRTEDDEPGNDIAKLLGRRPAAFPQPFPVLTALNLPGPQDGWLQPAAQLHNCDGQRDGCNHEHGKTKGVGDNDRLHSAPGLEFGVGCRLKKPCWKISHWSCEECPVSV